MATRSRTRGARSEKKSRRRARLCAQRAQTIFEGRQGTAWHGRGREMCVGVGIEKERERRRGSWWWERAPMCDEEEVCLMRAHKQESMHDD